MIHCFNFILNLSSDILKNVMKKFKRNNDFKENSQDLIIISKCSKKKTKQRISNRNIEILEAWYKNNNRHPYASKNEINNLALLTGLQENEIKRWLDNTRINSKTKPRKLFTVEDTGILINFFEKETDHPGPADLTFLVN
jgi:dGTP triphosphohydrolase